jgi:hypothetical protein
VIHHQLPGRRVRRKPKHSNGLPHALLRIRRDSGSAVHHAADGGGRDPRQPGDIQNGGRAAFADFHAMKRFSENVFIILRQTRQKVNNQISQYAGIVSAVEKTMRRTKG